MERALRFDTKVRNKLRRRLGDFQCVWSTDPISNEHLHIEKADNGGLRVFYVDGHRFAWMFSTDPEGRLNDIHRDEIRSLNFDNGPIPNGFQTTVSWDDGVLKLEEIAKSEPLRKNRWPGNL